MTGDPGDASKLCRVPSCTGFRDAKVKAAMTKVIPGDWGLGSVSGRTLQHTRVQSAAAFPGAWASLWMSCSAFHRINIRGTQVDHQCQPGRPRAAGAAAGGAPRRCAEAEQAAHPAAQHGARLS